MINIFPIINSIVTCARIANTKPADVKYDYIFCNKWVFNPSSKYYTIIVSLCNQTPPRNISIESIKRLCISPILICSTCKLQWNWGATDHVDNIRCVNPEFDKTANYTCRYWFSVAQRSNVKNAGWYSVRDVHDYALQVIWNIYARKTAFPIRLIVG